MEHVEKKPLCMLWLFVGTTNFDHTQIIYISRSVWRVGDITLGFEI